MEFHQIYFVGAGGIGMAALERYYLQKEVPVAGYDRTPSELTAALESEGAQLCFEDIPEKAIPEAFRDTETTLVVYTPAIPADNRVLNYFREGGFKVEKRAALLGEITRGTKALCFAGTHGKTTTSSMAAHMMHSSKAGCSAFLGGVLRNYNSNYLVDTGSRYSVVEADEFDRSFHHLRPYVAVITATDPDHLDIYGDEAGYLEGFARFTELVRPDGALISHTGLKLKPRPQEGVRVYSYSKEEGDFHAENIRIGNGEIWFDFVGPDIRIADIQLGVPVKVNIANGVAAIALAWMNGVTPEEIRRGMASFGGPKRRFDFHLKKDNIVLIDDYAHHPAELAASIQSVKELYAGRKVTGIFQPHLYTRTRDFAPDFAASLSLLDELILLDIYPAREEPIPGVTSEIIFDAVTIPSRKLIRKSELLDLVAKEADTFEVVLMVGAGDIDRLIEPVKQILDKKL